MVVLQEESAESKQVSWQEQCEWWKLSLVFYTLLSRIDFLSCDRGKFSKLESETPKPQEKKLPTNPPCVSTLLVKTDHVLH